MPYTSDVTNARWKFQDAVNYQQKQQWPSFASKCLLNPSNSAFLLASYHLFGSKCTCLNSTCEIWEPAGLQAEAKVDKCQIAACSLSVYGKRRLRCRPVCMECVLLRALVKGHVSGWCESCCLAYTVLCSEGEWLRLLQQKTMPHV